MTRLFLLCALVLSLTACSKLQGAAGAMGMGSGNAKKASVEVDGVRFKAKADSVGEDTREFSVTSSPYAVNPEAALQAARYQATRYCLLTFGGSDKEWIVGPDTPLAQLATEGDTLTLHGRCTQR